MLACVDSLVLGRVGLAGSVTGPHLVDLPHEEVVLVPWPDGTITRCYGPDQARELFTGAGLVVRSIQPRTMLSESVITHVLRQAPRSLPKLAAPSWPPAPMNHWGPSWSSRRARGATAGR